MPDHDEECLRPAHVVPTVVAHMMIPGVVQVPGDVSVSEAALLLEREHAPCLLVKETDTIFGLMTPTDIVKKVVAQGLEPQMIEVRSIMTRPVQFIDYDHALEDACSIMMITGASILIVTKENQPVGVLSAQDLMLAPPRRRTRIPTILSVLDDGFSARHAQNATIVQLSHIGARIETVLKIANKTRVTLALSLPGQNTPMTIHGKIMTCEPLESDAPDQALKNMNVIEIQFADLSNSDTARMKAWALQSIPSPSDRC